MREFKRLARPVSDEEMVLAKVASRPVPAVFDRIKEGTMVFDPRDNDCLGVVSSINRVAYTVDIEWRSLQWPSSSEDRSTLSNFMVVDLDLLSE